MQELPKESLIRFATALSALAVSQVGVGLTSQQELDEIKSKTQVQALDLATTHIEN
jgi:1-phosphofructokinase